MTTRIPFTPSNTAMPPFQCNVTLDGQPYTLIVVWNLAAQRWYMNLQTQAGVTVWYAPLIGSPTGYDIYLAPGLFTASTLLYRVDSGMIETNP